MPEASLKKLVLVPAIITFGVTLLRLLGELMHWSPAFFNPEAGGGGALVGIAWLVPVFGVYFALKLLAWGERPPRAAVAIGHALLGFAIVPVAGLSASALGAPPQSLRVFAVFIVASVVGGYLAFPGLARSRPDAPRLRPRRPHPGGDRDVLRDVRELGNPL